MGCGALWDALTSAASFLLVWISFLLGMAAMGLSNFSPRIFEGFFIFMVIRINKVNSAHSSSIVELRLLVSPILVFLDSERLYQSWVRTSGHTWSGLVVDWTLSISHRTTKILWEVSLFNRLNFVNHFQESQWNRECFFLRHTELNSRFDVITIDKVTLDRPEVGTGFQRHLLLVLPVETLPNRLEVLRWDLRSLRFFPAWEWVLGIRGLFLTILLYHLLLGEYELTIFLSDQYLFRVDSSMINLWCVQLFEFFQIRKQNILSKFSPRSMHTQERFPVKLSCQIMKSLIISCWNQMISKSSWGGEGGDPSDSPRKSLWHSPRSGWSRTKVDVLSSWSPPGVLIRPSAIGKISSPFSLGNITSFALSLFE